MSHLVEAIDLGLPQTTIRGEGAIFEKETNLVAGADEVIVFLVDVTLG